MIIIDIKYTLSQEEYLAIHNIAKHIFLIFVLLYYILNTHPTIKLLYNFFLF